MSFFLSLDVGNTAVKAGLFDPEAGADAAWTVARWPSEAGVGSETWAARLAAAFPGARPSAAGLASVVPALTEAVAEGVRRAFGVAPGRVGVDGPLPFAIGYQTPRTLGADRLAAVAAAFAAFGRDAAGRPRAVVALDAGTAVTVEAVTAAEGSGRAVYLGGAILPGPDALARALARGTAQLPEVAWAAPPSPIGRSTETAIQAGLFHLVRDGVAGLLDATTAALAAPGAPPPLVVATGGWGPWLAEHLADRIHAVRPHLVLEGVRLLCGG